uniref:VPS13_C domain-containing protein n=1 Tax=Echinostoma caproni TaxID=27848 RepID=A0A183B9P1_9TREM
LGSVSQILNAISLDEKHQHERAAILGIRSDTVPLWSSNRSSTGHPPSQTVAAGGSHVHGGGEVADFGPGTATQLGLADETLEDFELTRASTMHGHGRDFMAIEPSWIGEVTDTGALDIDQAAIAPLTAGIRGFMHGLVGGITSIVTQPYRGIQEDQFKGFVAGVGRGLLGTFTKPLGGIFDLFSGAMSTLSEVARSSGHGRPRRRRPRRSGLSKYALVPLSVYRLDEAVAQLQLHQLTLFTSVRHSLNSTTGGNHRATAAGLVEIGEELSVNDDAAADVSRSSAKSVVITTAPVNIIPARDSISGIIQTTVNGSWLSHTFHYPECVFHVLPVQGTGVVAIITDRAVWCVSNASPRSWISTERSTTTVLASSPTFYLTEHATLMFMLPYRRLDEVTVRTGSTLRSDHVSTQTTGSESISSPVYVVFIGDGRVSTQQLRCDSLPWGLNLAAKVREAQFRYIQAAFSLFRSETAATGPYPSPFETSTSSSRRAPLVPGHPIALSYSPMTSLDSKRLL